MGGEIDRRSKNAEQDAPKQHCNLGVLLDSCWYAYVGIRGTTQSIMVFFLEEWGCTQLLAGEGLSGGILCHGYHDLANWLPSAAYILSFLLYPRE